METDHFMHVERGLGMISRGMLSHLRQLPHLNQS